MPPCTARSAYETESLYQRPGQYAIHAARCTTAATPSRMASPRCCRKIACVFLRCMRNLVTGVAVGRILFGVLLLVKPQEATRGWIGRRAASNGGTQTVTRGLGARDLTLGAGALAALVSGRDARNWVLAGAIGDAADFGATATADDIPLAGRIAVLGMAAGAVAVSAGYLLGSKELAQ